MADAMNAGSLAAFLEMGGYGAYVWPAFALTAAVMVGLLIASVRSLRAREKDLTRLRSEMKMASGDPAGEA
ncbi:MAG TPA: heme exporter protein CcmD [Rhodospirillales bacterium]|jgi:heme exporter protein D|nr:heme exporter protein CcmD [Rhodospirillales bacterium]